MFSILHTVICLLFRVWHKSNQLKKHRFFKRCFINAYLILFHSRFVFLTSENRGLETLMIIPGMCIRLPSPDISKQTVNAPRAPRWTERKNFSQGREPADCRGSRRQPATVHLKVCCRVFYDAPVFKTLGEEDPSDWTDPAAWVQPTFSEVFLMRKCCDRFGPLVLLF